MWMHRPHTSNLYTLLNDEKFNIYSKFHSKGDCCDCLSLKLDAFYTLGLIILSKDSNA
eukprot:c29833_g1_i1 orf=3-173(-)